MDHYFKALVPLAWGFIARIRRKKVVAGRLSAGKQVILPRADGGFIREALKAHCR